MTHTTPEGWEKRIYLPYDTSLHKTVLLIDGEYATELQMKEFIAKEIAAARAEERQRCLKALPPERIIHDYIPEENTPANRAWNAYREIAIRTITTPLPDNKDI